MSDAKRALVLHLAGASEPAVFAVSEDGARELQPRLAQLLTNGSVHAQTLADGSTMAVNFAHVVTAHVDELPAHARVYGNGPARQHGFATA